MRDDAPRELREAVVQIARDFGITPGTQRSILTRILRVLPDPNNWSEYPNVWNEVQWLVLNCEWYHVYDYIEALHECVSAGESNSAEAFAREINDFFVANGIGWQLIAGLIEIRGPEAFEASLAAAQDATRDTLPRAHQEVHEALLDLSRRPEPDLTGAMQHSMAALEAISRRLVDDEKPTLGEILKRHPDLLPKPLDTAVEKMWGYASETARHGREGTVLKVEEVELVVGVVGSLVSYLLKARSADVARV
jgi:hypothetical protein